MIYQNYLHLQMILNFQENIIHETLDYKRDVRLQPSRFCAIRYTTQQRLYYDIGTYYCILLYTIYHYYANC